MSGTRLRRPLALATAAVALATLAACSGSSTAVGPGAAAAVWTIAPVVSSTDRPCTASPSPAASGGNTTVCSLDGTVAFELGTGTTGQIVTDAAIVPDLIGVNPQVDLQLTPEAAKELSLLSTAAAGTDPPGQVALVLDGRVVLATEMREPVTTGQVALSGFTKEQAQAILAGRLPTL